MNTGKLRLLLLGAVFVVGAVALVAVAMSLGRSFGLAETEPPATTVPGDDSPSPSPTPQPSPTPAIPEGFVEFKDRRAGIAIAYPSGWERLRTGGGEIALVATPNRRDSLLVRVTRLEAPIDERSLGAIKARADQAIASSPGVRLLRVPDQVVLDGAPGYFYFYQFRDNVSGEKGAHSHYVVFQRDRMIAIVFQALPKSKFVRLAPVFDQILATFRFL